VTITHETSPTTDQASREAPSEPGSELAEIREDVPRALSVSRTQPEPETEAERYEDAPAEPASTGRRAHAPVQARVRTRVARATRSDQAPRPDTAARPGLWRRFASWLAKVVDFPEIATEPAPSLAAMRGRAAWGEWAGHLDDRVTSGRRLGQLWTHAIAIPVCGLLRSVEWLVVHPARALVTAGGVAVAWFTGYLTVAAVAAVALGWLVWLCVGVAVQPGTKPKTRAQRKAERRAARRTERTTERRRGAVEPEPLTITED
jgi:hypothetical protein